MSDETSPWTCRICATKGIPSAYSHCPNCSHEVDWDEPTSERTLATLDIDRFSGEEYACCGLLYAAEVRFCGLCGSRLRKVRSVVLNRNTRPSMTPYQTAETDEKGPTLVPFLALDWILQDN